jgi:uncharacterized protein (DUF1800 family)
MTSSVIRPRTPRRATNRIVSVGASVLSTFVALAPLHAQKMTTSSPAGREQTADQQVHHALNRLAFGPRPGDVEKVRAMGVDTWIAQQLYPEKISDAPMDAWLTRFPTLTMTGAQFIAKYPPPGQQVARLAAAQQREMGAARTAMTPANRDAARTFTLSPEDSARLRDEAREGQRASAELFIARTGRAVASERQLQEVLVDFWANHFNVFAGKQQTRYYLAEFEHSAIRPHVLGNFRELLGAVAKSPAMLTYLDQAQSVADSGRLTLVQPRTPQRNIRAGQRALMDRTTVGQLIDRDRLPEQQKQRIMALPPEQYQRVRDMTLTQAQEFMAQLAANPRRPRGINENYARELMELHTLGVDGGYTQQDVMEVARALTGWTLSRGAAQGGEFVFRPETHDAEAKTILGQSFPAGKGQDEGERVLDLLANHPSTARFIATKLVRRFVSDEPPEALIDRAAATFTRTKGDLREVMRTIVTSDEFFAEDAYRAKVKTPFELVVSASRALGGQPDVTQGTAQLIARMGQPIYGRATPDGYPDMADEWINTGSILNRMNFGLAVGAGRLPGARLAQWSTARELVNKTPSEQVDGLVRALFGGNVSADTRAILTNGDNPLLSRAPVGSDSLFRDDNDMGAANNMVTPPPAQTNAQGARRARAANTANAGAPPMTPAQIRQERQERQRANAATLPELTGFPKLVGLAIGAPEFQRR